MSALLAAVIGFFVITLDAVIVNVALPPIQADLGGGISGLQWVVDGYTLMFAALLLSAGSISDRIGARRSFAVGVGVFVIASTACGLAPTMPALVAARFLQGAAAAVMMPASLSLIRHAYGDSAQRARAIGVWAMGGAVASVSGPVIGGLLSEISWRLIFFVNLPIGIAALVLLARTDASPRHHVPFDWMGQLSVVPAMGALTYGVIEVGAAGITSPHVLAAFAIAAVATATFVVAQCRGVHAMVPPAVVKDRTVAVTMLVGFTFMVGYYGLPFVMSLYLQQERGLTALATGATFLPMMISGALLTPCAARIVERAGPRAVIVTGLATMSAGLLILGVTADSAPTPALAALMVLIGLAGPLIIPPATAVLLDHVPPTQAGVATGIFHTSRQLGGALAVAVFGALLTDRESFLAGLHTSLLIAAVLAAITTAAANLLPAPEEEELIKHDDKAQERSTSGGGPARACPAGARASVRPAERG
ncbi:MFS transporter [Kribbella sp. NPDC050124]|uniref:MFS transporter n=1 Tax=Kribbella sp. NPDC050124 TaxID=3364114 RepID=UPI0037AD359A